VTSRFLWWRTDPGCRRFLRFDALQLALLILLFNPLVIYATVLLGKRVGHLKKQENDSTRTLPKR
jgi:hypothetical protein